MDANVGMVDRSVRVIVGLMILALFFVVGGPVRWFALLGVIPLATGVIGWCPAYLPFGLNTRVRS